MPLTFSLHIPLVCCPLLISSGVLIFFYSIPLIRVYTQVSGFNDLVVSPVIEIGLCAYQIKQMLSTGVGVG